MWFDASEMDLDTGITRCEIICHSPEEVRLLAQFCAKYPPKRNGK